MNPPEGRLQEGSALDLNTSEALHQDSVDPHQDLVDLQDSDPVRLLKLLRSDFNLMAFHYWLFFIVFIQHAHHFLLAHSPRQV